MKKTRLFAAAAALLSGIALNAETVVFINDTGADTNDGATPETPVKSLTKALTLIPTDDDGTIVFNGKFTQLANFEPNIARTGTITYTQKYDGIDYRGDDHDANAYTLTKGVRLGLTTDAVFENITFHHTATGSNPYLLLIANYNSVTIGDGCEMTGTFGWSQVATSFTILGGCQDNTNKVKADCAYNPNITIRSGHVYLVAFNRGGKGNSFPVTKDNLATVNIEGGILQALYLCSVGSGASGSTTVNITGGELAKYGTMHDDGRVYGDGKTMTLNLSGLDRNGQYAALEYIDVRMFEKVMTDLTIPVNVFESASYTLEDGTEMPYRVYHTPAGGADDPRRLVLYLHGMGSRGDDNSLQLSSMGAAPVYPITNEISNAVIIAPQVPSGERWVTLTGGYSFESEQTKWLTGAQELTKKLAAENGVAPEYMYAVGSSNGAAAIWAMLNSDNNMFARVIPISGYGEENPETETLIARIGSTPMWVFHGTDDATVTINGMQALAPKLAAANPNFRYTEVDGADHSTIWRTASMTPGFTEFLTDPQLSSGVSSVETGATAVKVDGRTVSVMAKNASLFNVAGMAIEAKTGNDNEKIFEAPAAGVYIATADGSARKILVK